MLNESAPIEEQPMAGSTAPPLDRPAGPRPFLTRLGGRVFYLPVIVYFGGFVIDSG
ncbi:MAG: hypothetical protein AAF488_09640 [Planctomycetota bacterium]